jgi:hypothetical protein
MPYLDFLARARANHAAREYPYYEEIEVVNGVEFALYLIRQAMNGRNAVVVMHYVGGRKVSKAAFLAQYPN